MPDEEAYTEAFSDNIEQFDTDGSVRLGARGENKPHMEVGGNMPATAEELSELMRKYCIIKANKEVEVFYQKCITVIRIGLKKGKDLNLKKSVV